MVIKKYGILAISFLAVYALFILGSVSGGIGITGDAISFLDENKMLFVYVGIGIAILILLTGIAFWIKKILKKKKEKRNELGEIKLQKDKKFLNEKKLQKDKPLEVKKNEVVKKENTSIQNLLLQGGRFLVNQDVKNAEKIYEKIKKAYNSENDKKLYSRIVNYYNNILKQK